MLTQQHRYARHIAGPLDRRAYKLHMCGLCHALGDGYGLAARLLTSHEMILLNLLVTAQRPTGTEAVPRRCPLNPLRTVRTNADDASRFAAAVAVGLAEVSVRDDVEDSGGRDVLARIGGWLLGRPARAAHDALRGLGFDPAALDRLSASQRAAEADPQADPARPTALTSAAIFAHTAALAGVPGNAEPLAAIGAHYGAYLYLMDAYRDLAQDMAGGHYSPLRRFAVEEGDTVALSAQGLRWLLARFRQIQAGLAEQAALLVLYQQRETLLDLLYAPLKAIVGELEGRLAARRAPTFRRWGLADAVKAAFFVLPAAVAGVGLAATYDDNVDFDDLSEDDAPPEKPKRGRKRKRKRDETTDTGSRQRGDGCGDSCAWFYWPGDCGPDSDNDCCPDTCEAGHCGGDGCDVGGCDGCGDLDCGGADCNCN